MYRSEYEQHKLDEQSGHELDLAAERRMLHDLRARILNEAATTLWEQFTANEKTGVRFGMFPAGKMEAAEKKLEAAKEADSRLRFESKDLSVALMEIASKNGGMRA